MIPVNTVKAFVKTNIDINVDDYVIDTTSSWASQSMVTPFPAGKLPVKSFINDPDKERLGSMLGSQDTINYDPVSDAVSMSVSRTTTIIVNGKRIKHTAPVVRTIFQKGTSYVMHVYNGLYAELYRLNWTAISANSSLIAQIKAAYAAFYGSSEGSDESANLINYMATMERVVKYKPFTLSTDEIEVSYIITGQGHSESQKGLAIDVITKVNGLIVNPERIFTQMYPVKPMQGLPNTAQNRGSGAAFSQRQSFELSSDLKVRGVEHVMAGGIFNFKTVVTLNDSNGNNVFKEHNQAIDLTRELSTYNYFNL